MLYITTITELNHLLTQLGVENVKSYMK